MTESQKKAIENWWKQQNPDDYEFNDNHRVSRIDNTEEMIQFEKIESEGCCGSIRVELDTENGKIVYGFNYGH